MDCRPGCGACCIAPSISSAIPEMQEGKPVGVRCIQLADDFTCKIYFSAHRPAVCGNLQPSKEMCGKSREEALDYLTMLEKATAPSA
ncbi:MAG: YkgJ family cysteine cluster protein [Chitinivibrionales bacterium]